MPLTMPMAPEGVVLHQISMTGNYCCLRHVPFWREWYPLLLPFRLNSVCERAINYNFTGGGFGTELRLSSAFGKFRLAGSDDSRCGSIALRARQMLENALFKGFWATELCLGWRDNKCA